MRIPLTIAAIALVAASAACGSSSTPSSTPARTTAAGATTTVSPGTTATAGTRSATAATSQPPSGSVVDVTGIVGTLNLSGNVIEIKRLQGAAVTQIAVDARTVIRKATGGALQLKDVRTSDRIIAKGTLNDRQDQLIATDITVQDVVPGAQPGG